MSGSSAEDHNTWGAGYLPRSVGETAWDAMSIEEILAKLATMSSGAASGDAAAVLNAIRSARAVSRSLVRSFGADTLRGLSADTSGVFTTSIADRIAEGADAAEAVGAAISGASGVLGATVARAPELLGLQQQLREHPEDAPQVRSRITSLMSSVYSSPMVTLASTLGDPPPPPGDTATILDPASLTGDPAAGGDGPLGGSKGPSATVADLATPGSRDRDGRAPSRPGRAVPKGSPAKGSAPSPGAGTPAITPAGGRRPGDDPRSLTRGGLGDPQVPPGARRGVRTPVDPARKSAGAPAAVTSPDAPTAVNGDVPLQLFPGVPVTGAGAGSAGAGGISPQPSAPARSLPATPAPAGSRTRTDDTTHRVAPYLHHGDNGTEIVGELPLVGPPVIGDWALRASLPGTGGATAPTDLPVAQAQSPGDEAAVPGGDRPPTESPGVSTRSASGAHPNV